MSSAAVVLRAADRPESRWRNGGGITREVCREPVSGGADFDWRVSIADVETSGPFSTFAGVERTILLLEGGPMSLTVGGVARELRRLEPFTFDGGLPTWCDVPRGPTRDLNVMCRADRCAASVQVIEIGRDPASSDGTAVDPEGAETLLVIVLDGELTLAAPGGTGVALARLDAVRCPSPVALQFTGAGAAAAVRFTRRAG